MRIASTIRLTDQEHQQLLRLRNHCESPERLVERLDIILLAHAGKTNQSIARRLGISENKVARWRNRYSTNGLTALEKGRPRGKNHAGKSTLTQTRLRRKIIKVTTEERPSGASHWTCRALAEKLNTTHTFVHRVWKSVGLKPHLFDTLRVSTDPDFEETLNDVVGVFLDPPENTVVFCTDENHRLPTPALVSLDKPPVNDSGLADALYTQLYALTRPATRELRKSHHYQEFLAFLEKLVRQTPAKNQLHLIVDNHARQEHDKIREWLSRNPQVQVHCVPGSSTWLLLVEKFFGIITARQCNSGVSSAIDELENKVLAFLQEHEHCRQPFVWTRSATQV